MRHLNSWALLTNLRTRPPRVCFRTHGVRQVALPWAEPMSRFTVVFERPANDVLKECDVDGAVRLLRLELGRGAAPMERAVARGLAREPHVVPARFGVEEKAAGLGADYVTGVSNISTGTVEHLADERRQTSLEGFFERFSAEGRERIEVAAIGWLVVAE